MGMVNIDDELHESLRRRSGVSGHSINAQAGFWTKVGMFCEMNPGMS